jgi:hypothetical protein
VAVAADGWNSPASAQAVTVMQRAGRREAAQWTWTAGWMTDEGLADTWEQMDRAMRSGRFEDAPVLLGKVVRRAYAGEAAAVQTGDPQVGHHTVPGAAAHGPEVVRTGGWSLISNRSTGCRRGPSSRSGGR